MGALDNEVTPALPTVEQEPRVEARENRIVKVTAVRPQRASSLPPSRSVRLPCATETASKAELSFGNGVSEATTKHTTIGTRLVTVKKANVQEKTTNEEVCGAVDESAVPKVEPKNEAAGKFSATETGMESQIQGKITDGDIPGVVNETAKAEPAHNNEQWTLERASREYKSVAKITTTDAREGDSPHIVESAAIKMTQMQVKDTKKFELQDSECPRKPELVLSDETFAPHLEENMREYKAIAKALDESLWKCTKKELIKQLRVSRMQLRAATTENLQSTRTIEDMSHEVNELRGTLYTSQNTEQRLRRRLSKAEKRWADVHKDLTDTAYAQHEQMNVLTGELSAALEEVSQMRSTIGTYRLDEERFVNIIKTMTEDAFAQNKVIFGLTGDVKALQQRLENTLRDSAHLPHAYAVPLCCDEATEVNGNVAMLSKAAMMRSTTKTITVSTRSARAAAEPLPDEIFMYRHRFVDYRFVNMKFHQADIQAKSRLRVSQSVQISSNETVNSARSSSTASSVRSCESESSNSTASSICWDFEEGSDSDEEQQVSKEESHDANNIVMSEGEEEQDPDADKELNTGKLAAMLKEIDDKGIVMGAEKVDKFFQAMSEGQDVTSAREGEQGSYVQGQSVDGDKDLNAHKLVIVPSTPQHIPTSKHECKEEVSDVYAKECKTSEDQQCETHDIGTDTAYMGYTNGEISADIESKISAGVECVSSEKMEGATEDSSAYKDVKDARGQGSNEQRQDSDAAKDLKGHKPVAMTSPSQRIPLPQSDVSRMTNTSTQHVTPAPLVMGESQVDVCNGYTDNHGISEAQPSQTYDSADSTGTVRENDSSINTSDSSAMVDTRAAEVGHSYAQEESVNEVIESTTATAYEHERVAIEEPSLLERFALWRRNFTFNM